MATRDTVGQLAEATGAYAFTISGAALDDLLTFEQGFQIPTAAMYPLDAEWYNVSVRVDVLTGAEAGQWAIMHGTLKRAFTGGAITFTSSATGCTQTSRWDATNKIFTALAIASGDDVELRHVVSGMAAMDVRSRVRISEPWMAPSSFQSGSGGIDQMLRRAPEALLAMGEGARAASQSVGVTAAGAIALGDGSLATRDGAVTIGRGNGGVVYGTIVGGCQVYNEHPFEASLGGMGNMDLLQATATPVNANLMRSVGYMAQATTGGAPAYLQCRRGDLNTGGTDSPRAGTGDDEIYVDAGLHQFKGRLVAVNVSTGEMKVWDLEWLIRTLLDYSTTELVGTLTKTVVHADAGSEPWDCNVEDVAEGCKIEVTGEPSNPIVWGFTYEVRRFLVYV